MNTLTYNLPNDIYSYAMNCPDDLIETYIKFLKENGAYNITVEKQN